MFMRVNSKCAHQVRPPLAQLLQISAVAKRMTAYIEVDRPRPTTTTERYIRRATTGSTRIARRAGM
jgi:hypothetical protein